MRAATLFKAAADALNSWQGLGDPTPYCPAEQGPNTFDLAAVKGPGRQIFSYRSAPWDLAAKALHPVTMTMELRGNDVAEDRPAVRCTVSLCGHGPEAEMVATLLAADVPGEVRLESVPRTHSSSPPPEIALPLSMAAQLVSSPARVPGAWPPHPFERSERLFEMIEESIPPHAAFFGGSGLGKTTLLQHLIAASFAAGNTVVVVCPHGDLAARAAIVWNKAMRVALSVLTRDPLGPHPLSDLSSVMLPPLNPRWEEALVRINDDHLTQELLEVQRAIENDGQKSFGMWATSKLEAFTADDRLGRIIGQSISTVDLECVVNGETLLVAAPAAALGDTGSSVVLSALVVQLWHRIRTSQEGAPPIDFYIDECHRIPHQVIEELLAESRKYGVRLRLATQSPIQLDPKTRDVVLTNSGAIGTFRVGPREAADLGTVFQSIPHGTLSALDRHWLALTNGQEEMVAPVAPPTVDAGDRTALVIAHRRQHPSCSPPRLPFSRN